MLTIKEYFDNILKTEGYEAWAETNNKLIDLYEDEEADLYEWATAHNVDLDAVDAYGIEYFLYWVWDNFED